MGNRGGRLHGRLTVLTLATALTVAAIALILATVGVPAFATADHSLTRRLSLDPLPLSILAVLFAAAEAWAVHRGAFLLAWMGSLGLVAFAAGVYPSAGHLVAPLVAVNTIALGALHTVDRWLVLV